MSILKELGMREATIRGRPRSGPALFRSISEDGTEWLFFVRCDDTWSITSDGEKFITGSSDSASIVSGVQRYLSLIRSHAEPVQEVNARPMLSSA